MFTVRFRYFFICVAIFTTVSAPAAGGDIRLDEVVVTGTKTERKLLDAPVRTEVVSKQEIVKTHARDVAEALRNQPGLLLKEIHGKSGSQVWLQGMDSDRVLVLINGRPVSASTGSSVDLSQLAVGDIDHVEIVKGAVSALYGSSAMGGVVNIIKRRSDAPFQYTFVGDAGSYSDKNLDRKTDLTARHALLDLSANNGRWSGHITGDLRDSDGFDLDKSTFTFEGEEGPKYNINGEVVYHPLSGGDISFNPSFYQEKLSQNLSSFAPGIGEVKKEKRESAERMTGTLSFNRPLKNEGKLSGYLIHEDFDDVTEQDVLATSQVDQQREANFSFDKAEVQWDQAVGNNQLWTLGLVGFQASIKQHQDRIEGAQVLAIEEITPGADRDTLEAYVQDDIFIGNWELLPGLRFQNDSDFGTYMAPKLNLMITPGWWTGLQSRLRFGVGRGYRAPNLKERFFTFDHSALGYMVLGNPDLTAESSDSIQAGIEISNDTGFHAELSLFHNNIKDLIDTDLDAEQSAANNLGIFRYTNIARARTQGIDLVLDYEFSPSLSGDIGYSYLDAIDRATGNRLTERPARQIKLGLDWKLPGLSSEISLRGSYQSEEYIDIANTLVSPDWSTLDLKFNQPIRKHLTFFIGIDNVTDEHRDPSRAGKDFRPKKGRFMYAGLRLEG